MKHTHILFVILAIILCVGCDYIQSPEEAAGENKNDLQYVNQTVDKVHDKCRGFFSY